MKTSFLAFFFFLLFACATAELVYDVDGEPLTNAGKYYIAAPGIGGGQITFAPIGGKECPLGVVLPFYSHPWPTIIGTPLMVPYIDTNYPLILSFADFPSTPCTNSSRWVVIRSLPVGTTVMVGDSNDYPNHLKGWFFIKPYGNGYYKFVFCHNEINATECGDVGALIDNEENRRLAVTDKDTQPFIFRKVEESSASEISMVV